MGTEVRNIVEDVLSACVSSATADPITLIEPYHPKGMFKVHGQLHVMFNAPAGFGKSTILDEIPEKSRVELLDYTLPSLVGSISKQGSWIEGFIMKSAGKCLIVDEHHNLTQKSKNALLMLTEQQKYSRALGYKVPTNPRPINRKFLKVRVDGNYINIRNVRFSSLFMGIYQPKKEINDRAFASRFLPIAMQLELSDLKKVMLGFNPFKVNVTQAIGGQIFEDYEKFVNILMDTLNIQGRIGAFFVQNKEFLRRLSLHFVKLSAWASGSNSVVDDWEKYIPYIPFFAYNTVASTLTLCEYEILMAYRRGLKQDEIGIKAGCTRTYVSLALKKMRGWGLC